MGRAEHWPYEQSGEANYTADEAAGCNAHLVPGRVRLHRIVCYRRGLTAAHRRVQDLLAIELHLWSLSVGPHCKGGGVAGLVALIGGLVRLVLESGRDRPGIGKDAFESSLNFLTRRKLLASLIRVVAVTPDTADAGLETREAESSTQSPSRWSRPSCSSLGRSDRSPEVLGK